jgi:hypothetical protein
MEALNTQDAIDELSQETIFLAGETERLDAEKIDEAEKGVADGIATLDSTGKIPLTQIPDGIGGDNLISGKRFTSFGDSITYRNLWQPHIIERFGLIHTNCGIGSTKVAGAVNATYPCFWEPSRISAVQASNPDIVTILGGANDWSGNIAIGTDAEFTKVLGSKDKTTFKGAYSYIIETLLAWKPSLAIILLTTTWGDSEALNSLSLANRDYAKATKEVAWYYGLLCVDLRGEMGLNAITSPYLLVDTVHPTKLVRKEWLNVSLKSSK